VKAVNFSVNPQLFLLISILKPVTKWFDEQKQGEKHFHRCRESVFHVIMIAFLRSRNKGVNRTGWFG